MKITILTVCYNNQETILATLNSVLSQNYKNIEHIIIDGKSTDKTKIFLKKYPHKNKKIFYIKKGGVYNALNFGIKKATGDILHILHADDIYNSVDTISKAIKIINKRKEKIFTSDVVFFKKNKYTKVSRFYCAKNFKTYKLNLGIMPPHTGLFLKKDIYKNFLYDETYKIAGDFDFLTRALLKKKEKFYYLKLLSVRMKVGGISTKNILSYITTTLEIIKTFKKNKMNSNLFLAIARLPLKMYQLYFFRTSLINKDFKLSLTEFYKKFTKYDFIIKNKLNYLELNKNFIYTAMNLAFLGNYGINNIKKNQYTIHWLDGIFSKNICNLNTKVPGREILKSLKLTQKIKKITVLGNLSHKGKLYLNKKFKKKVVNVTLPYGNIETILKEFKHKTSKNELTFITLPTPKQEILADYISKNNNHFKIICIGGSISIACGDEKKVPEILINFEFLWRLQYETARRFKRLIYTFVGYLFGRYISKSLKDLKVIYEI